MVLLGMIFSTTLLSNMMDLFSREPVIHQFSRPKNKEGKKGFPGLTTKKNRKVGTLPVIRRKGGNSGIESKVGSCPVITRKEGFREKSGKPDVP